MEKEGNDFMQRPCNDQGRPEICLSTHLCYATTSSDDRKKWEIHLGKVEEQCKPRGSKLVAATQYKVLTQGDMELPEYIEKCR